MNSPYYHMFLWDIDHGYFHDFEIEVNIWGQLNLEMLMTGNVGLTKPTFPLNTDGIDPSGSNILIERVNITNFDDAIAVKPVNSDFQLVKCSENITAHNMIVRSSFGLSVGSVPPHDKYNCIKNVTFHDITMHHPIKAIYVKTNSGTTESMLPGSGGEITDITYENIDIHRPVWWGIYIGPQ